MSVATRPVVVQTAVSSASIKAKFFASAAGSAAIADGVANNTATINPTNGLRSGTMDYSGREVWKNISPTQYEPAGREVRAQKGGVRRIRHSRRLSPLLECGHVQVPDEGR